MSLAREEQRVLRWRRCRGTFLRGQRAGFALCGDFLGRRRRSRRALIFVRAIRRAPPRDFAILRGSLTSREDRRDRCDAPLDLNCESFEAAHVGTLSLEITETPRDAFCSFRC